MQLRESVSDHKYFVFKTIDQFEAIICKPLMAVIKFIESTPFHSTLKNLQWS